jgi:hypothetical protein
MARRLPHEPPQVEKFRDLARQLETDDDEARLDERLKELATAPHKPKAEKPSAPKSEKP